MHVLHLKKKDELSLITLATHLRIVDEVRIHNFHLSFYLTRNQEHVRFTQAYWGIVQFVLPYIHRGPRVDQNGKEGHVVEVTFDDFLQPAIRVWKKGEPYYPLV